MSFENNFPHSGEPKILSAEESERKNLPLGTTEKEADAMLALGKEGAHPVKLKGQGSATHESMEKAFNIMLPENPESVLKLTAKLNEYKARLTGFEKSGSQNSDIYIDHKYRELILSELLTNESVNYDQARNMLAILSEDNKQKFNQDIYEKAFALIKDYAETGGRNVMGGTGLK